MYDKAVRRRRAVLAVLVVLCLVLLTAYFDKGSSDGVEVNDPVVNGEGLVGKVLSVSGSSSVVMLLTDQDFGVSALDAKSSEPGSIESTPGSPGDLMLNLVPNAKAVRTGDS